MPRKSDVSAGMPPYGKVAEAMLARFGKGSKLTRRQLEERAWDHLGLSQEQRARAYERGTPVLKVRSGHALTRMKRLELLLVDEALDLIELTNYGRDASNRIEAGESGKKFWESLEALHNQRHGLYYNAPSEKEFERALLIALLPFESGVEPEKIYLIVADMLGISEHERKFMQGIDEIAFENDIKFVKWRLMGKQKNQKRAAKQLIESDGVLWKLTQVGLEEARNLLVEKEMAFPDESLPEFDDDFASLEGDEIYILHKTLERDPKISRLAKQIRLRDQGELTCEVCGFDFFKVYGSRGQYYIECHHSIALSGQPGPVVTTIQDLNLLCANCHRMIHRRKPWPQVEELRNEL